MEGKRVEKIICTPKYIKVHELKKPAVVTDRLRRDFDDLKGFDWVSMKCGVRRLLNAAEVIQAVSAYCNVGSSSNETATFNNDDGSLVSYDYDGNIKFIVDKRKKIRENKYNWKRIVNW